MRSSIADRAPAPPAVGRAFAVIDLFAGAGGFSIGLGAAGFEAVAAVEIDPDACVTYRLHHPWAKVWEQDIATVDLRPLRGEVDLIAGGPPCQPFSIGGKRLAAGDHRNGIPSFIEAVEAVSPAAFVMENVPGLATGARRPYLDRAIAAFAEMGYTTSWAVLGAADYGVPQKRRRLFLVGTRVGEFAFPRPTHGPGTGRRHRVAGDAVDPARIIGAPNVAVVTYARSPSLRPDPYHGHVFNGGGRPIDPARPAPTMLTTMGGNKTPWVDTLGVVPEYHAHLLAGGEPRAGTVPGARRITAAEAAALQSFKPSTRFVGTRSSQYRQVGNAVPPRLSRAVGRALAACLSGRPAPGR